MRFEFDVELTPVWHRPKPPKEPKKRIPPIRRTLVLAYQLADYMAANNISSLKELCRHVHMTRAHATQIMNTRLLSPRIQEQILLKDNPKIADITEYHVRTLVKESVWKRQEMIWLKILLWK